MTMIVQSNNRGTHQQPFTVPKKTWQFESFDLTVSTVDSDSLSSCSYDSDFSLLEEQAAQQQQQRKPLIVETPRRVTGKRVSFQENERGSVKCYYQEIERIDDLSLWWNADECKGILRDCVY